MTSDSTSEVLLELDGTIIEVGGGYWIKCEAKRVPSTAARPFGISYSLCMFGPDDTRLVCFDNAHPVTIGSGPGRKRGATRDHVHRGEVVKPYAYTSAESLVVDFWDAVAEVLSREGIT